MYNHKKEPLNLTLTKPNIAYMQFSLLALLLCACTDVPEHCGDRYPALNPSTQFCNQDGQPWDRCGGQTYNTSTHECYGGSVRPINSVTPTYTLTVNRNPTDGGTATASNQSDIAAGTRVNITADASGGYTFGNWTISGNGTIADANSASTSVTVDGDVTVTANWTENSVNPTYYTLTVNRNPTIGGTTNPASSQSNIAAGTRVNITADASGGYTFGNWTISGNGTIADANSASTSVTVDGNVTVVVNYGVQWHTSVLSYHELQYG